MEGSSKAILVGGTTVGIGGIVLGAMIILFGILLSLTLIGAIIGIPLIILGATIIFGGVGAGTLTSGAVAIGEEIEKRHKKKDIKEEGHCNNCGIFLTLKNVKGLCMGCKERICKDCSKKLNGKIYCKECYENYLEKEKN